MSFGFVPPPQQETDSCWARASGRPMCSVVIHRLLMPAQVMLPVPGVRAP